jgi:hypothetical protein
MKVAARRINARCPILTIGRFCAQQHQHQIIIDRSEATGQSREYIGTLDVSLTPVNSPIHSVILMVVPPPMCSVHSIKKPPAPSSMYSSLSIPSSSSSSDGC